MGEILARGLWRWRYGVPFLHPEKILYAVYGELRTVDRARPSHQDSFYDILLLGGSTLHPDWGRVEAELRDQLAGHGRKNVRIFNLAQPAHSSRDSLLKYAAVGDSQFEMVIVYDGLKTHYGREARSVIPFARNIETIATLASARHDHLLLMTFAAYMPSDYSLKAFQEKRLDYDGHREPIETWGEPQNVMAAVARHNEAVRALVARHPEVSFVDEAALMPGSASTFDDVCHFTAAGSARFVQNLVARWP